MAARPRPFSKRRLRRLLVRLGRRAQRCELCSLLHDLVFYWGERPGPLAMKVLQKAAKVLCPRTDAARPVRRRRRRPPRAAPEVPGLGAGVARPRPPR